MVRVRRTNENLETYDKAFPMPVHRYGSKSQVFHDAAMMTTNRLKKDDLVKNEKTGEYVSKSKHLAGQKAHGHVTEWVDMTKKLYIDLNPESFQLIDDEANPGSKKTAKTDVRPSVAYKDVLKKAGDWTLRQLTAQSLDNTAENKRKLWKAYVDGEIAFSEE
eukprot:jgi/Mesvir1/11058/Mv12668-RA.1